MKKSNIAIIIMVILILLVLIISFLPRENEGTVKIGVILPLTGTSSDLGQYIREGIDLALEELNQDESLKYNYQLIYEDSQYNPKQSVSAIRKLIDLDAVKYVIGAYGSSETLSITPIAEENKIILVTPGSQSDQISEAGDYIFRTQINTAQESEFFADYIYNKIGNKKISLFVLNTDYGKSLVNKFTPALKKLGGNVGSSQEYDAKETDFRSYLLKIKDEDVNYVLLGANRKSGGLILKQAKEMNLNITFFATSVIEGAELINTAGVAAEGLIYPYPYDVESENKYQKAFREKYYNKYGRENEVLAANGYDTLKLLSLCIEKRGGNVDDVKSCLYGIKDYDGSSGKFSFDSNGDVSKEFIIKTIKDGKFVKI